jgi:hypothetical protein
MTMNRHDPNTPVTEPASRCPGGAVVVAVPVGRMQTVMAIGGPPGGLVQRL